MDSILAIIVIIFIISIFYSQAPILLGKIVKYLYRIKLLLEFQNPAYDSEQLWQVDQEIRYWEAKNHKYDYDYSDKNKELKGLIFSRMLMQYQWINLMRQHYFQAIKNEGDVDKVDEKYDDNVRKLVDEIHEIENKICGLDSKIKGELDSKNLDFEFTHKWRYDED